MEAVGDDAHRAVGSKGVEPAAQRNDGIGARRVGRVQLVLVEDPTQRTMAGALGAFQGHYATDVPLLCAGTILIMLPTLVLFVLFQRQIITALLQGSVKG